MEEKKHNFKRRERELVRDLREEGITEWQQSGLSALKKNLGNVAATCRDLNIRRSRWNNAISSDSRFAEAVYQVRVEILDEVETFLLKESLKDPHLALKVMSKLRRELWGDSKEISMINTQSAEEVDVVEVFESKHLTVHFPAPKK